jgi:hypothetical protein
MIIALALIVCLFGSPFILVGYLAYLWFRAKEARYLTIREYLNHGLPVPPELLQGKNYSDVSGQPRRLREYGPRRELRRGIVPIFSGIGTALALYLMWPHTRLWAWGLIPWIIGVGYLVAYFIEPEDDPVPPQPDQAPQNPPLPPPPQP